MRETENESVEILRFNDMFFEIKTFNSNNDHLQGRYNLQGIHLYIIIIKLYLRSIYESA